MRWALNQQHRYAQQCYQQQLQGQSALQQLADGDLTVAEDAPEVIRAAFVPVQQLVSKTQAVYLQLLNCRHETQASTLRLQETTEHQQDQVSQVLTQQQGLAHQLSQSATQVQDAQAKIAGLQQALTQLAHPDAPSVLADAQQQQQTAVQHLEQAETEIQQIQQQISLIAELADQSNILALNTAMQAAMAGEAGRAFRVVSDEVQRLAQQASDTTRQISRRLQAVQTHQQTGLQQLQHQAEQLSLDAVAYTQQQQQLTQLQADSQDLSEPLHQWHTLTEQQSEAARLLGDHLHIIHTIGQQTTEGVTQTAEATAALDAKVASLAAALALYQQTSASEQQPVLSATA
jgi:twitching motility protein PilJ